jgi:hypothetical protein
MSTNQSVQNSCFGSKSPVKQQGVFVFPSASRMYVGHFVSKGNNDLSKNNINFPKGDMLFMQIGYA